MHDDDDQDDFPRDQGQVDWDRYLGVRSRAGDGSGESHTPLGDPMRWGGAVDLQVTPPDAGSRTFVSENMVRVQVGDVYPRTWTAIGTLGAPADYWDNDEADFAVALELTMGVGQNTLIHLINLRALIALDAAVYASRSEGGLLTFPWVMMGGILAQAVSSRILVSMTDGAVGNPGIVRAAMQVTPLAAGTWL